MTDIIFLTDNPWTPTFDRRVLDQALYLTKQGSECLIITLGSEARVASFEGVQIIQLPLTRSRHSHDATARVQDISQPSHSARIRGLILRYLRSKNPRYLKLVISVVSIMRTFAENARNAREDIFISAPNVSLELTHISETLQMALGGLQPKLWVGCDLPGALAALQLRAITPESRVWFDAHEFYSEQTWLKHRPGFGPEIQELELSCVRDADIFTCVSTELTSKMVDSSGRSEAGVTLTNAVRFNSSSEKLENRALLDFLDGPTHVLLFHGNLNRYRGIVELVDSFRSLSEQNWRLLFVGRLDLDLPASCWRQQRNIYVCDEIPASQIGDLVSRVDAIVMPYPVLDLNTQFGFPNKLGDCIQSQKPFIYNVSLESIGKIATEFDLGIPMTFENPRERTSSLSKALMGLSNLSPRWLAAEEQIGWTSSERVLNDIQTSLNLKVRES